MNSTRRFFIKYSTLACLTIALYTTTGYAAENELDNGAFTLVLTNEHAQELLHYLSDTASNVHTGDIKLIRDNADKVHQELLYAHQKGIELNSQSIQELRMLAHTIKKITTLADTAQTTNFLELLNNPEFSSIQQELNESYQRITILFDSMYPQEHCPILRTIFSKIWKPSKLLIQDLWDTGLAILTLQMQNAPKKTFNKEFSAAITKIINKIFEAYIAMIEAILNISISNQETEKKQISALIAILKHDELFNRLQNYINKSEAPHPLMKFQEAVKRAFQDEVWAATTESHPTRNNTKHHVLTNYYLMLKHNEEIINATIAPMVAEMTQQLAELRTLNLGDTDMQQDQDLAQ